MTPDEAKLGGEVLKMGNDWAKLLLGPTVKQVGLILGDYFENRLERIQLNREKTGRRIETILIEENVSTKLLSDKVATPLLEGISLEDDEVLQGLWANLFVNYIDSEKSLKSVSYPGILKQISSSEAQILKTMIYDETYSIATGEYKTVDHDIEYEDIANLVRLGLIEPQRTITYSNDPEKYGQKRPMERDIENDRYFLTQFGHHFIEACYRGSESLH